MTPNKLTASFLAIVITTTAQPTIASTAMYADAPMTSLTQSIETRDDKILLAQGIRARGTCKIVNRTAGRVTRIRNQTFWQCESHERTCRAWGNVCYVEFILND